MSEKIIPIPSGQIERETTIVLEDGDARTDGDLGEEILTQEKDFTLAFMPLLMDVVSSNYRALIGRLKKNFIWLVPLFVVWVFLWTVPMMTWYTMPSGLHKIGYFLIFLTATYNGFIGKAVFLSVISRNFIPMGKQIKKGEGQQVIKRLTKAISITTKALKAGKEHALGLFVTSAGIGLIISNVLTRNNKIDKYFVCLLFAIAILDDLSKGRGNPVLQMITALIRDTRKLVKSKTITTLRTGYIAGTGFALGLSLAFIPGQFANSYTSKVGMVMGAMVTVIGIGLIIAFRPKGDVHAE